MKARKSFGALCQIAGQYYAALKMSINTATFALCILWKPSSMPSPRAAGFASTVHRSKVWSFGGLSPDGQALDTFWNYENPEKSDAPRVRLHADAIPHPTPRMYSTLTGVGDTLVLCGGWDPGERGSGGRFFDDIHTYNVSSECWQRSSAVIPDGPISRHVAARTINNEVLIHSFRDIDRVMLFDPVTDSIRKQKTTGDSPKKLSMQASAVVGFNLVVYGGATKYHKMSNELYTLDMRTWVWTRRIPGTQEPGQIASSAMASVGHDSFLMFGGACIKSDYASGAGLVPSNALWLAKLDHEGGVNWMRVGAIADPMEGWPRARVATGLHNLDGDIWLHGGWDPQTKDTFADSWILSTASL